MKTVTITSVEAFTEFARATPAFLADFWKDNCVNCKMLELSFQKLLQQDAAALEDVTLAKLKLEELGEDFFRSLGIRQAPTLALFQNGAETERLSGFIAPDKIAAIARKAAG